MKLTNSINLYLPFRFFLQNLLLMLMLLHQLFMRSSLSEAYFSIDRYQSYGFSLYMRLSLPEGNVCSNRYLPFRFSFYIFVSVNRNLPFRFSETTTTCFGLRMFNFKLYGTLANGDSKIYLGIYVYKTFKQEAKENIYDPLL